MRLFYDNVALDGLAWLAALRPFGVGVIRPEIYLHDTGKVTQVQKFDALDNPVKDEAGNLVILDAPIKEQRRRLSVEFVAGEKWDVAAVKAICEKVGLVSMGEDDEVRCANLPKALAPEVE